MLQKESEQVSQPNVRDLETKQLWELISATEEIFRRHGIYDEKPEDKPVTRTPEPGQQSEHFQATESLAPQDVRAYSKDPHKVYLPKDADLNRILRYEASIQRQLSHAINQLERLQRVRKGEHVPPPVAIQVNNE